jgi:TBC1 domain family protein 5
MRLLFGREFPFQDVLSLWDLLFAEGLRSELIEFTCVAMLLRIRWQCTSETIFIYIFVPRYADTP